MMVELIDDFFAEHPAMAGYDKVRNLIVFSHTVANLVEWTQANKSSRLRIITMQAVVPFYFGCFLFRTAFF
jgi:hypothetical protein